MLSIKNKQWNNWSELIQCRANEYYEPRTIEEVQSIVQLHAKQHRKIRVVGAGHSFTPLVETTDTIISLDKLQGIVHVDNKEHIASVYGGTRLKHLGPLLFEKGYAMENLGDINEQSIAGAVSTGTHGTGHTLGTISTQVVRVTIVLSNGEILEISRDKNSEYFEAMRTSLGLLGIIVTVDLKVLPTYQLTAHSYKTPIETCLNELEALKEANRHFEFYYFPFTKTAQVKTANITYNETAKRYEPSYIKDVLIENNLFKVMSETSRVFPRSAKTISKLAALGVPTGEKVGDSYQVFATPRLVRFHEMEYSVPASKMKDVIEEIQAVMSREKHRVHFPIECRYVKEDSIWLSPAFERDSAFIAVHMYKGMEYEKYFAAMEAIFIRHEGRAHWGKMHTMNRAYIDKMYPKINAFLDVRNELDELNMFVNPYLDKLLHITQKG